MQQRLADEYIQKRNTLKLLLSETEVLAKKANITIEGFEDIRQSLSEPLKITIVGNKKSGKLTILEALLDSAIISKGHASNTLAIHSENLKNNTHPFKSKFLEIPNANDLCCVIAKPFDLKDEKSNMEVSKYLTNSDVILCVLSTEEPWAYSFWSNIEKYSQDVYDRLLLILNKADFINENDLKLMTEHLNKLMDERLQQRLPILPLAKNENVIRGYDDAFQTINSILENNEERNSYLTKSLNKLHRVLDLIESTLDERSRSLESNKGFLSSLESDIYRLCMREINLYIGSSLTLATPYTQCISPFKKRILTHLSLYKSTLNIFLPIFTVNDLEEDFYASVTKEYIKNVKINCKKILVNAKEEWQNSQHHLEERLGVKTGEFKEDGFLTLLPEIIERQEAEVEKALSSIRVKSIIENHFHNRVQLLKKIMALILLLLSAAGILGAFNVPPHSIPAFIALMIALVLAVYYCMVIFLSKQKITEAITDSLSASQHKFAADVAEPYKNMIQKLFTGYAPLFISMRSNIADAKISLEPLQREHHELFLKVNSLELSQS